jgi:hypothetical protein
VDPLKPTTSLLAKLAQMAAHIEAAATPNRYEFDGRYFEQLRKDTEVQQWLRAMRDKGIIRSTKL